MGGSRGGTGDPDLHHLGNSQVAIGLLRNSCTNPPLEAILLLEGGPFGPL